MKKEEFVTALRTQSEPIHLSSRLRQKTLDAAYGKEQKYMKKKIPAIALAVVLSIVCCAAALAAAGSLGIFDFAGRLPNTYIPENAQEFIETDVAALENDLITAHVRELYYDGHTSRIAVEVTPKDSKTLLLGPDIDMDSRWSNMNPLNPSFDPADQRTVRDYFLENGFTSAWQVDIRVTDRANGTGGGAVQGWSLTETGAFILYHENTDYYSPLDQRSAELTITLIPLAGADGAQHESAYDEIIRLTRTLSLTSSAANEEFYISTQPALFPSAGIQVDQMVVEVKPYELYVSLYYTVVDEAAWNTPLYEEGDYIGTLGSFIGFELIDSSLSGQPWDQRLPGGMNGSGEGTRLSAKGEKPERHMESFTIGRSELHESYSLRLYDWATKNRYETAEVAMRPATAEDLAALPTRAFETSPYEDAANTIVRALFLEEEGEYPIGTALLLRPQCEDNKAAARIDVRPSRTIMLLGPGAKADTLWRDVNPEADADDARTVLDVFRETYCHAGYLVSAYLTDGDSLPEDAVIDWTLDNSGKLHIQFAGILAPDQAKLAAELTPVINSDGEWLSAAPADTMRFAKPFDLTPYVR